MRRIQGVHHGGVGTQGLFCCQGHEAPPLVTVWNICFTIATTSPLIALTFAKVAGAFLSASMPSVYNLSDERIEYRRGKPR